MIDPYAAGRLDETLGLPWRRLEWDKPAPGDLFDRLGPDNDENFDDA